MRESWGGARASPEGPFPLGESSSPMEIEGRAGALSKDVALVHVNYGINNGNVLARYLAGGRPAGACKRSRTCAAYDYGRQQHAALQGTSTWKCRAELSVARFVVRFQAFYIHKGVRQGLKAPRRRSLMNSGSIDVSCPGHVYLRINRLQGSAPTGAHHAKGVPSIAFCRDRSYLPWACPHADPPPCLARETLLSSASGTDSL